MKSPDARAACFQAANLGGRVQRLMILDSVLRDRNCWWMDTERDKRSYFSTTRHTGLSASEYPQIAFGGGPQKTIRYFPDKPPIGDPSRAFMSEGC